MLFKFDFLRCIQNDITHVDFDDVAKILDPPEIVTVGQIMRYKFKKKATGLKEI